MTSSMTNRPGTSVSLQTILTHTFHGDRVVNAAKAVDVKNGKFPKKNAWSAGGIFERNG